MMIFEPFRGFLRRAQYIFLPYSQTEPIHLIIPIVTIFAFTHRVVSPQIGNDSILTPLAGSVTVLAIICFVQDFQSASRRFVYRFYGCVMFISCRWLGFISDRRLKMDFVPKLLRLIVVLGFDNFALRRLSDDFRLSVFRAILDRKH